MDDLRRAKSAVRLSMSSCLQFLEPPSPTDHVVVELTWQFAYLWQANTGTALVPPPHNTYSRSFLGGPIGISRRVQMPKNIA